jgi:hypothetical protein
MGMIKPLAGAPKGYLYHARIPVHRLAEDYTPRVVPYFSGAAIPLEAANILWYESQLKITKES